MEEPTPFPIPPPPAPALTQPNRPTHTLTNSGSRRSLTDPDAATPAILAVIEESTTHEVFRSLEEQVLQNLEDLLMYQHKGLVSTALTLIFRFNSMRSEVSGLLQEVHLLHSTELADFYHKACVHAVRLRSLFRNHSNLKVCPAWPCCVPASKMGPDFLSGLWPIRNLPLRPWCQLV